MYVLENESRMVLLMMLEQVTGNKKFTKVQSMTCVTSIRIIDLIGTYLDVILSWYTCRVFTIFDGIVY